MCLHRIGFLLATLALWGCASQVQFEPEYLAEVAPSYLAESKIVILIRGEDQQYVFEGRPESQIGENITLTVPIGSILREVVGDVLQSYFQHGVVFTEDLGPEVIYTTAIEPEIRNFSYRYDRRVESEIVSVRVVEEEFEVEPVSIITPSIQFELSLRVHDFSREVLLEKLYDSGLVAGESYIVTSRPHERINATFHRALRDMIMQVAEDIELYLVQEVVE